MNFKIWQIYFANWQLAILDPDFSPYDNSSCPTPDLREFYVFRKEYLSGNIPNDTYVGFLSWKFKEKTGMSGQKFEGFCRANPGYDVYFVNPYPLEIHFGNVWLQGEASHSKDIVRITQKIFEGIGLKVDLRSLPANLKTSAFCNFWVGNKRFWDGYMSFCLPIWDYIFNKMPEPEKAELFSCADKERGASYFSFIFERLFTTYLLLHPEIKGLAFRFNEDSLLLNYTREEAALVLEIQRLEDQFPGDAEASRRSAVLRSALHFYHVNRNYESARFLADKILRKARRRISSWFSRAPQISSRPQLLDVSETKSIWVVETEVI